ncbi:MAG: T9SS type A sorting domain-containing protein [Candidatus Cloacimonetes bacterium]|nr:T9SS type A sorting domain-containing protein [Candidatus Cloacimonadota bacterium]
MTLKNTICIVLMLCSMALSGLTLTVSLDGSAQYTSIQAAVVAASNGDVVLVYPGTYYENVDFLDKSIAINSLEASTGDSTYISSTIINGGRQAPCVSFKNGLQNASLRGFTLTNGLGAALFTTQTISGGGILIYNLCSVEIVNCVIHNNHAWSGAGIFLYKSSAVFRGLLVLDNHATSFAGGMFLMGLHNYTPNIVFDADNRCSVFNNYGGNPTDILVLDIKQDLNINLNMVSVPNPTEFYINRDSNYIITDGYHDTINYQTAYRTEVNHDLYVSPEGNDDNSGLCPTQALKSITWAVHKIAADSVSRNTVWILPGIYDFQTQNFPIPLKSHVNIRGSGSSESIIDFNQIVTETLSQIMGSRHLNNIDISGITIRGVSSSTPNEIVPLYLGTSFEDSSILDVVIEKLMMPRWGMSLRFHNSEMTRVMLKDITTRQSAVRSAGRWLSGFVKDCVFENIESLNTDDPEDLPTVIDFWVKEQINIENCVFRNIRVQDQQMIFHVSNSRQDNQPVNIVINNSIFDDLRHNGEYPIVFGNRDVDNFTVSNCTFVGNYGTFATIGTGGRLKFRNNIMYNPDAPKEMYIYNTFPLGFRSRIDLDFNLIHGGLSGISNPFMTNILEYGQNNINVDPLFESTDIDDPMYLRLSANSPCINAGTPDTSGLNLPPYDMAGNWRIWDGIIDMGCYEYGSELWVSNDDPMVPEIPAIRLAAYPNPFKTSTNIKTSIPVEFVDRLDGNNRASIDIYNIKGQKMKTISFELQNSLEQVTVWDGRDYNGNNCATGIYFLNLKLDGKQVVSRKVTLIK